MKKTSTQRYFIGVIKETVIPLVLKLTQHHNQSILNENLSRLPIPLILFSLLTIQSCHWQSSSEDKNSDVSYIEVKIAVRERGETASKHTLNQIVLYYLRRGKRRIVKIIILLGIQSMLQWYTEISGLSFYSFKL